MTNNFSSKQRERIFSFIHAPIQINPQQFKNKWDVNSEFIAELCNCDVRTVNRWLASDRNYTPALRCHQWELALADLILEKFEDLPAYLQQLLCPDIEL